MKGTRSMELRFNTREQLVEALEARREWAVKHDARVAKAHRQKEDRALSAFRGKCRELGRMNLADLKAEFDASTASGRKLSKLLDFGEVRVELPTCPESAVAVLNDAIGQLAITHQERFVLNGDHRDTVRLAHWLLTHDDNPAPRTVCA